MYVCVYVRVDIFIHEFLAFPAVWEHLLTLIFIFLLTKQGGKNNKTVWVGAFVRTFSLSETDFPLRKNIKSPSVDSCGDFV